MQKYCISVEDMYGTAAPKVPQGYELTGEFRKPTAVDVGLHPSGRYTMTYDWVQPHEVAHMEPRLILEKLPVTPTIKDVYGTDSPPIPEGWKFKEFRQILDDTEKIHVLGAAHSANSFQANYLPDHYMLPLGSNYANHWRIVLEQDLSQFRYESRPSDVYGSIPPVPDGYRVIAFRPPVEDEIYISPLTKTATVALLDYSEMPRLILSPLGPR